MPSFISPESTKQLLIEPHLINKQAVAQRFSRAATTYHQAAQLQRDIGYQLITEHHAMAPGSVLDAGCGTGYFSQYWRQQNYQVTALDLSEGMLGQARQNEAANSYLLADIERLPLPDRCMDLVFSNLAVQWCEDLPRALGELQRVVRPGGQVLFSTLVEGTLAELGQAWRRIDGQSRVNSFLPADYIEQVLKKLAGKEYRLRLKTYRLDYPNILSLMRNLHQIGATHSHQGRAKGLSGRKALRLLQEHYPQDQHPGFSVSYCCLYGVLYGR